MAIQSNSGQRKMTRRLSATVHGHHGAASRMKLKRAERERVQRIMGRDLEPKKPAPKLIARALKKKLKNRETRAWKNDLG